LGGDRSLRELEQKTERQKPRVARSTIQDALDAKRLPSIDQAVAMVRAMTDDESLVQECRRRWTAARSAVTGVAMPEMPAPPSARQAPLPGTTGTGSSMPGRPAARPSAPEPPSPPHPSATGKNASGTGRWRRKRTVIAAVTVAASAAVTGGVYALSTAGSGGSSGSSHTQNGYTLVYRGRSAATPDYHSSIDLTTGKLSTQGQWLLSSDAGGNRKGAFDLQDGTQAALSAQPSPTPAQCLTAISRKPLAKVSFDLAPVGTTFCLRWTLDGDIAVVHVLDLDRGNWAIRVALDYYRHAKDTSSAPGSAALASSPVSEAGYTARYRDRAAELRSSDDDIDLTTGKRTGSEDTWYLSSNAGGDSQGAFELAPGTDAYVAGVTRPSPGTCAQQIARHHPATAPNKVHFREVPSGRWFCLRSRATGDIAVVQVRQLDGRDWGATMILSCYRPKT
jgi:hypothetical protein